MLNNQQKAAIAYVDGPLLVSAVPGSGKTRVITEKIAHLIKHCGYAANAICAVTFTNKAANEMRTRIASMLPTNDRHGLMVSTFHTLGLKLIKRHLHLLDLRPGFSIFDADDSLQVLKGLLPSNKSNDRAYMRGILQQISQWKNAFSSPERELSQNPFAEEATELFLPYQQALKTYNAVDFDDLIRLPVQLLQDNKEVLSYWQDRIRYLLVDEYQDSNVSQYLMVKLLVGDRAHFTVVGDDDQSIYAWRGARPENLKQLQQDYPHLKIIQLEQNYRSTNRILAAAGHLIEKNPHLFKKKLWSELGYGEPIRAVFCRDEMHEAEFVVFDIMSHRLKSRAEFGEYAILYRGNHQSLPFEKMLRHHGIPYRLSGGQSFFAKTEIKDLFAYLKLLCNEADDAAFLRVIQTPKRGIGEVSLNALSAYAQERSLSLYIAADHLALSTYLSQKARSALQAFKEWMELIKSKLREGNVVTHLKQMVEESAYEAYVYEHSESPEKAQKKMDNVWELIEWIGRLLAKDPTQNLSDVINKLILIDILEQSDEQDKQSVQLMTLHAAKGLEFGYVYLVGMEEDLLPHRISVDEEKLEEERRLAYVGMTRAEKELCFTLAKQRRSKGQLQDCQPSRFLIDELPQEEIEWFGKPSTCEIRSKNIASSHLMGMKDLLRELP
jgi:ATP-dependent DNA helicase Rep